MTIDHELLTTDEQKALKLISEFYDVMIRDIIGVHPITRRDDMTEIASHVHALQNWILAQVPARLWPSEFRTLGNVRDGWHNPDIGEAQAVDRDPHSY